MNCEVLVMAWILLLMTLHQFWVKWLILIIPYEHFAFTPLNTMTFAWIYQLRCTIIILPTDWRVDVRAQSWPVALMVLLWELILLEYVELIVFSGNALRTRQELSRVSLFIADLFWVNVRTEVLMKHTALIWLLILPMSQTISLEFLPAMQLMTWMEFVWTVSCGLARRCLHLAWCLGLVHPKLLSKHIFLHDLSLR